MILKGIEVGNPELGLLFKLLLIDQIVLIKNFTHQVETFSYNDLKNLDELELTVSEFCELHSGRIYVK